MIGKRALRKALTERIRDPPKDLGRLRIDIATIISLREAPVLLCNTKYMSGRDLRSALRSDRRADQVIGIIDRRANQIDRSTGTSQSTGTAHTALAPTLDFFQQLLVGVAAARALVPAHCRHAREAQAVGGLEDAAVDHAHVAYNLRQTASRIRRRPSASPHAADLGGRPERGARRGYASGADREAAHVPQTLKAG